VTEATRHQSIASAGFSVTGNLTRLTKTASLFLKKRRASARNLKPNTVFCPLFFYRPFFENSGAAASPIGRGFLLAVLCIEVFAGGFRSKRHLAAIANSNNSSGYAQRFLAWLGLGLLGSSCFETVS
jgi:hypothetical protein